MTTKSKENKTAANGEYDNTLRGVLFKNDKEGVAARPDYRGQLETEDGTQYWLSAWIKKSKAGQTFMSLALKPKEQKEHGGDIPF